MLYLITFLRFEFHLAVKIVTCCLSPDHCHDRRRHHHHHHHHWTYSPKRALASRILSRAFLSLAFILQFCNTRCCHAIVVSVFSVSEGEGSRILRNVAKYVQTTWCHI